MTVANIHRLPANWQADNRYLYIGRANKHHGLSASVWANPYRLENKTVAHREFVIARFAEYLLSDDEMMTHLPILRGKTLVCYCDPLLCHGHVLSVLANLDRRDVIPAPMGKRTVADTASMITTCVDHVRRDVLVCPTDDDYQAALKAEETAKTLLQGHKTKKHKDDYEHAKEHRVQVGGAIVGTQSTIRRMSAMIAGEIQALQAMEIAA